MSMRSKRYYASLAGNGDIWIGATRINKLDGSGPDELAASAAAYAGVHVEPGLENAEFILIHAENAGLATLAITGYADPVLPDRAVLDQWGVALSGLALNNSGKLFYIARGPYARLRINVSAANNTTKVGIVILFKT